MSSLNTKIHTDNPHKSFTSESFPICSSYQVLIEFFKQSKINALFEFDIVIPASWRHELPFLDLSVSLLKGQRSFYIVAIELSLNGVPSCS